MLSISPGAEAHCSRRPFQHNALARIQETRARPQRNTPTPEAGPQLYRHPLPPHAQMNLLLQLHSLGIPGHALKPPLGPCPLERPSGSMHPMCESPAPIMAGAPCPAHPVNSNSGADNNKLAMQFKSCIAVISEVLSGLPVTKNALLGICVKTT